MLVKSIYQLKACLKDLSWVISMAGLFLMSCSHEDMNEISSFELTLSSSDSVIVNRFAWAKHQALAYAHNGSDPVGKWYEAALPSREAFCMRDVAHQSVGANFLGLRDHTKNMLRKFAINITEKKDWCSYWEINRGNQPAPADYRNDNEFWYNLPANFDVIQACYYQYLWTGDTSYLYDSEFITFYKRSLQEYVDRWDLKIKDYPTRERFINKRASPWNVNNAFHSCRGLPSYEESASDLVLGSDLMALQFQAYDVFSKILALRNEQQEAKKYRQKADSLKSFFHSFWWNEQSNRYNTLKFEDGRVEARPSCFLLTTGVIVEREDQALDDILNDHQTNIENASYFPKLFYDYEHNEAAYSKIAELGDVNRERREYPEVSYALIEAMVSGMMGIIAEPQGMQITTMSRLSTHTEWAEISGIPVLNNFITVKHEGNRKTTFTNQSGEKITWKAVFNQTVEYLWVNGQKVKTQVGVSKTGLPVSYVLVVVEKGETKGISVSD